MFIFIKLENPISSITDGNVTVGCCYDIIPFYKSTGGCPFMAKIKVEIRDAIYGAPPGQRCTTHRVIWR